MAYTEIHKITATLNAALDYISGDKVEEITKEKTERILSLEGAAIGKNLSDSIKNSLDYAVDDKEGIVTFKTYTSYNCCFPLDNQSFGSYIIDHSAYWSKKKEKDKNRKTTKDNKEVVAWHLIQSFEESIRSEIANEIGRKLIEKIIPDYPCQISTHTNTEHTHNHIIFSAWDVDGKKYNDDIKAKNLIRKVSDELCQEYGLHVLEDTKEMKLVKYQDSDGNLRYYEPTDRKIEMIRQREEGTVTRDDVNSYRNTYQYEDKEAKKETIRVIVKRDIDYLLPQVSSFESLLQRLKEQGYQIRDKKKNGEWLTYITYKPPTAERGVRDYTLSEDEFYKRENIERIILAKNKEMTATKADSYKYFDEYVVGECDPFNDINENYRVEKDDNNRPYTKQRSIVEKKVISDIRKDYRVNRISDYRYLHKSNNALTSREKQILESIQFKYKCLKFLEHKDIITFTAIQERIDKTSEQIQRMNSAIDSLRMAIEKERKLLLLPAEIEKLSYKIAEKNNNDGYKFTEYYEDVNTINKYKKILQAKGLVTPEKLKEQEKKVKASEAKLRNFEARADLMNSEMETYNLFNAYVKAIGYDVEREMQKEVERINENRSDGRGLL